MTSSDSDWYFEHVLLERSPDTWGAAATPGQLRRASWRAAAATLLAGCTGSRGAAARIALRQGFVITRAQVRMAGVCDAEVRRLVRRGEWTATHRGVLSILPSSGDGLIGSCAEIAGAAAALVRPGCSVSHASAARMHALPLLVEPVRPTLTHTSVALAGARRSVIVQSAPLRAHEIQDWFGVPVTAPARTVVDIARLHGLAAGLVAADAALADGLVTVEVLADSVHSAHRRPGVQRARRAVELASPLAESPLESLTRLCLVEGGLDVEPQRWVVTARGRFRVDLMVSGTRVVVEADGAVKYRRVDERRNPLYVEKLRQEAIEQAGYRVVRVNWREVVDDPRQVVARVRAALAAAVRSG